MTTKASLIETDPALRYYQLDALLNIFLYAKCLVKMFCGVGKSIIITNVIIHGKKELNVIVFPSLALIMQYSMDYLLNEEKPYKKHFKKYTHINISSEKLENVNSTTDPKEIKKFLNKKGPKIVLVTYQSYQVLLDNLDGKKIGLVCYDEAHHVTSPEYQKLVFFRPEHFEKEVFFTATPRNENGITMYDRDANEKNMCGDLAYDYTYLQGLNDGFLNAFQICIDMFTQDANVSSYEAMARAILERGTSRVLSFHSGVNGESNTNVWNFVNPVDFQKAFDKVQQSEFPEKNDYYKKITFKGMDGKTPAPERKRSLNELDNTPDNEIYIISSCETIGEGVDTKKANMCVFADPKSSITKIIQNIGRVVRPNPASPLSTILIPCFVDMEHYAAAQGDRVKTDELIREQMRATNGDYAPILNVLAALRQEDPELYDMCLNYPNKEHKEQSLNEQGYRIVEEDDDDYDGETYTPQEVEDMKEDGETPLEIHTNETIERFNTDSDEPLKRLYYDEEEEMFKPIVKMDDDDEEDEEDKSESEDDLREIQPPKQKRIGMSIHHNSDIEIIWGVKEELDFNNKFCSVVIDCEVSFSVEKWMKNLEDVKKYIDENEKRPSTIDKNNKVKILSTWMGTQKKNYSIDITQCKHILKSNPTIHTLWTETINSDEYRKYFDRNELWKQTLLEVKTYIDTYHKRPAQGDKNKSIKQLGSWIGKQKSTYSQDITQSKCIMREKVIHSLWSETINDTKYKPYLNRNEKWKQTLSELKTYIDTHQQCPPNSSKNKDTDSLAKWLSHQRTNYNEDISLCKQIMKYEEEIYTLWKVNINDPKYKSYLGFDRNEEWKKNLTAVKQYIDEYQICPTQRDKNEIVKKLGLWICNQKKTYNPDITKCDRAMKDEELHTQWTSLINDPKYKDYLVIRCPIDIWKQNLHNLKKYITENKTFPGTCNTNAEIKKTRKWFDRQRTNYKKKQHLMKNKEIYDLWTEFINDPKPKATKEKKQTPPIKKNRKLKLVIIDDEPEEKEKSPIYHKTSAVGELHKTYRRMRSDTLHEKFKADPQLWRDYHAIRNQNLASFDPASIPSNIIIRNLENDYMNLKRTKKVADMGCGQAPIAHYFRNKTDKHQRFDFYNYDHQSGGDPIISETDISSLPLEDETIEIAIMSLALWGTSENCTRYIKEAYRILEKGGGSRFYIIDCTNKWSSEPTTPENASQLLRTLLTSNGFDIIENKTDIGDKFCLFVCSKN